MKKRKKTLPYIYMITLLGFMAGIYHGKIALWYGEDPQPHIILPYCVNMLPAADQAALEKGIRLPSAEALIRFMEDYCS